MEQPNMVYLMINRYHKKGDKLPCLKTANSTLRIDEPGEYQVAIWAPKEGKKAYYMRLTKVEEDRGQEPQNTTTSTPQQEKKQETKKEPPKPANPSSLFN